MKLQGARIVLTGAAGGIGEHLAAGLAARGARLLLVGRRARALEELARRINAAGGQAACCAANIASDGGRRAIIAAAGTGMGGVDVLIHNAGVLDYGPLVDTDTTTVEQVMTTNVTAPMLLTRAALPQMLARGGGRIVAVGSTFGSIGYSCFAAYSASKFALRGFCEALRRELQGSGVGVTLVVPRAVRTPMNTHAVLRLAGATGMRMDPPERVAARVIDALEHDRSTVYVGFPEALFARINALLPGMVDFALRGRNAALHECARSEAGASL